MLFSFSANSNHNPGRSQHSGLKCAITANIATNEQEISSLLEYFSQRVQAIFARNANILIFCYLQIQTPLILYNLKKYRIHKEKNGTPINPASVIFINFAARITNHCKTCQNSLNSNAFTKA